MPHGPTDRAHWRQFLNHRGHRLALRRISHGCHSWTLSLHLFDTSVRAFWHLLRYTLPPADVSTESVCTHEGISVTIPPPHNYEIRSQSLGKPMSKVRNGTRSVKHCFAYVPPIVAKKDRRTRLNTSCFILPIAISATNSFLCHQEVLTCGTRWCSKIRPWRFGLIITIG